MKKATDSCFVLNQPAKPMAKSTPAPKNQDAT